MLTCIACSKQQFAAGGAPLHEPPDDDDSVVDGGAIGGGAATPSTRHAIKALTAQIKDMALKASGAYRHCKPCAGSSAAASRRHHPYHHRSGSGFEGSDAGSASDRFHYAYRRAGSSAASTPRLRGGGVALWPARAQEAGEAQPQDPLLRGAEERLATRVRPARRGGAGAARSAERRRRAGGRERETREADGWGPPGRKI